MVVLRHHHHSHLDQHYEKAEGGGGGKVSVELDSVYDYPSGQLPAAFELLSKDNVTVTSVTNEYIKSKVLDIVRGRWDRVPWNFSDGQRAQLWGLDSRGIACLVKSWLLEATELPQAPYCNASWDATFCWPPTPNGTTVMPTCSEVWESFDFPGYGAYENNGYASRVCAEDAVWQWPDYTDCFSVYSSYLQLNDEDRQTVRLVHNTLVIIPALSTILLGLALMVFWYFRRCIWCERISLHSQLMFALLVRSFMLVIIAEPYNSRWPPRNRHVDFILKAILSVDLYATISSINWMFLEGIVMNGRWTTNVFYSSRPYRTYFVVGWIIPMIMIAIFAMVLQTCQTFRCWEPFAESEEAYLFIGPIVVALLANLLFLNNIMRVLRHQQQNDEVTHGTIIKQALKATFLLFPLLGVNNIVFSNNPSGKWSKVFVICHTICGSSQGIFVALLYCFFTREVLSAMYIEYRRFREQRMVHFRWPTFCQSKEEPTYPVVTPQQQSVQTGTVNTVAQQVNCNVQIRISSPPPPVASPRHVLQAGRAALPTIDEEYLAITTEEMEQLEQLEDDEEYFFQEEDDDDDNEIAQLFAEIDLNRKVIRETML